MANPKYVARLDRAAAGINPFLIVIAIGLALVDGALGIDRLRDLQASLPPVPIGTPVSADFSAVSVW